MNANLFGEVHRSVVRATLLPYNFVSCCNESGHQFIFYCSSAQRPIQWLQTRNESLEGNFFSQRKRMAVEELKKVLIRFQLIELHAERTL